MIAPLRNYFLALLVFNLSSCASMQAVDVQDAMRYPPPPGIDIGSLVEVETLDERELRFRVTGMTDQGLGGKYGFIAWENMARLRAAQGRLELVKPPEYSRHRRTLRRPAQCRLLRRNRRIRPYRVLHRTGRGQAACCAGHG